MWTDPNTPPPSESPAGCFCRVIRPQFGSCLTCTCPGCGANSRYGAPIAHFPSCPGE